MLYPRLAICVFAITLSVQAQPVTHAQKAQMAIPFGQVEGSLLTTGELLLFVDTEQPAGSIAARREEIESLTLENDILTLATKEPLRDRSGPRNRFAFKLADPAAGDGLVAWFKTGHGSAAPAAETKAGEDRTWSYNAKHTHFPFGECSGKLVFSKERFSYESVENAGHSRQWNVKDLKEVKRENPYEIDIKPFDGNDYKFKFIQKGMSSDEYRTLVDFVTAARMPK